MPKIAGIAMRFSQALRRIVSATIQTVGAMAAMVRCQVRPVVEARGRGVDMPGLDQTRQASAGLSHVAHEPIHRMHRTPGCKTKVDGAKRCHFTTTPICASPVIEMPGLAAGASGAPSAPQATRKRRIDRMAKGFIMGPYGE